MLEVLATIRYSRIEPIGIGEGMNSTVFRAHDPYLQRIIAVKEVSKRDLGNDFDSYCNEARAMFATADSNVVGLEYVCETADLIAFAMPFFPNGSLKAKIQDQPLDLKSLLKVAHGVLAGVGRIHSSRFLHLDLKPSNILFDDSDRPLVGDFGQSRRVSNAGTVTFPNVYRWEMPPEVWSKHVATVESDIYQLGVLLYRCANGESVFQAQRSSVGSNDELQRRISRGRFPDVSLFLPHIPKRIRSIIRKSLRVDPSQRYHSASDLASALGRVRLPLNWRPRPLGGGAYRWNASRDSSPDFEVELLNRRAGIWRTCVWTDRNGERRRKGVSDYWKEGLSYIEALRHLTDVFADLNLQT